MLATPVYTSGEGVRVIGEPPIVLHGNYDPDQMWFPFMKGTLVPEYEPPRHAQRMGRTEMQHQLDRRRAEPIRLLQSERILFHYEAGVPQLCLPFDGWRRVTKGQRKMLASSNFPGWDRVNGEVCRFTFDKSMAKAADEWCEANCHGRYYVTRATATFERLTDAIHARLAFG